MNATQGELSSFSKTLCPIIFLPTMSSVWSLVIKSIPDRGETWGHNGMSHASCHSPTWVMEMLWTLLVIGLQPLFLPTSAREPSVLPLFCDLCVYTVSPLCAVFSPELSNTSNSYPQPLCFLPTPRGNQDTPHFCGSASHTSCSALTFSYIHVCSLCVTTDAVSSTVEELWSHKTFTFLLTTKNIFFWCNTSSLI